MKNILKSILGANLVSFFVLLHSGLKSFISATENAFTAAHINDSRDLLSIPVVSLYNVLGDFEPHVNIHVSNYGGGKCLLIKPLHY